MFKKYLLSTLIIFTSSAEFPVPNVYSCQYQCNDDPLLQIYPNQNMCTLLAEIPPALQNLNYVMYPNCDIYNTNRFGYNKRFNVFPAAIIVPQTVPQLIDSLAVLREDHLSFAVRSGGHCYGPGSLSSSYIIDLRNFNDIIPDVANKTVYIGAGAHLGEVIEALGAIDYAIPTGTCPSVGVAGLALGGGLGLLSRQYGLTADSITSITMINADGQVLEVNKKTYPDLFWALRGAGANAYGIVIGFTFNMYYIPKTQLLNLTWRWNTRTAQTVMKAWQEWIKTIPNSITTEIIFKYSNKTVQIAVNALKANSSPFLEWQTTFKELNPKVTFFEGTYLQAASIASSTYTMPFSKVKSKFLFEPLSKDGTKVIIEYMEKLLDEGQDIISFIEIGSAGGALTKGNTAYFPRKAYAWMFMFSYWPYEYQSQESLAELKKVYCKLEPYTSEYSYANLVDFELGDTYLNAYYGNHVRRLVKIKNEYDPTNLFTWCQGIPLEYHESSSDCS